MFRYNYFVNRLCAHQIIMLKLARYLVENSFFCPRNKVYHEHIIPYFDKSEVLYITKHIIYIMIKMSAIDLSSKFVIIGGKRQTIADVQKTFAELEFTTTIGTTKVIDTLLHAQEPLTREQIAKKSTLSVIYTVDILGKLMKYDYVVGFHIGKRKTIYYALTETGHNALSNRQGKDKTENKSTMT
jgi:hypothetical protein